MYIHYEDTLVIPSGQNRPNRPGKEIRLSDSIIAWGVVMLFKSGLKFEAERSAMNLIKGPFSNSGFKTGPAKLHLNLAKQGFSRPDHAFLAAPVSKPELLNGPLLVSDLRTH